MYAISSTWVGTVETIFWHRKLYNKNRQYSTFCLQKDLICFGLKILDPKSHKKNKKYS